MRKFYRRGISLALALVMMAALLAGCGNKDGVGGDSLGAIFQSIKLLSF